MGKYLFLIFGFCFLSGCVEPFEFQTETFQDALVIEASLTNEMKRHRVMLSSAVRFEDSINAPERNAQVRILDEMQNTYEFVETEPGIYRASSAFAAQKGLGYTLTVETSDGTVYSSDTERFTSESEIQEVYAERETNDQGEDGIFVYADSFDSSGESLYHRYEYEETYKIIAPNWSPLAFELTNYEPCNPNRDDPRIIYDLEIVRRAQEEQTCYNTVASRDIIQASAAGLSETRVQRFPVRFIPGTDFILTHRYSILVKQYVQSADAFSYYQSLDNFSSSTSVFTEIQPGLLEGNITAENDADKLALGYFEVASVSEKRLFFGFRDFYPDAPFPLYIMNCVPFSAPLEHVSYCFQGMVGGNPCPESLIEGMARGAITYFDVNTSDVECEGPYTVVKRECGDCTALGTNIVPDFWEE